MSGEAWHGTANGYNRHGCRCDDCRTAVATYQAQLRRQRQGRPLPPWLNHGTRTAYVGYRCRCTSCRHANTAYELDRLARKQAAS